MTIEGHVFGIVKSESHARVGIRPHNDNVVNSDMTLSVKPNDADKFYENQVIVIVLGPQPEGVRR